MCPEVHSALPAAEHTCIGNGADELKSLKGLEAAYDVQALSATNCSRTGNEAERKSFEASYEMEGRELGRGASGSVFAAVCRRSGRQVAVKTYEREQMKGSQVTCMMKEVAIHERLSHPRIVSLDGVFVSKDRVHIVTERLHGGELFDLVAESGRLSERKSAEIGAQLLQALVYLHDQHIVNRDVKLENIVLEKPGGNTIKVIDLGYATTFDPKRKLTKQCGTIGYAAPEICTGQPYDEGVDVWSAGVCMYTMLTGCVLVVEGKVRFGSRFQRLPADAQDFVKALLAWDPRERLSAREALKHPWLRKHTSAQQCRTPPPPETEQSLVWQAVPDLLLRVMAFGAMGICCGGVDTAAAAKMRSARLAVSKRP